MFDRVGDDPGLTPVRQAVRDRFLEVNGEHPMTEVDDTYVRAGFTPATDEQLGLMAAGLVPLPSYLLSDGTPMVHRDHLDRSGGPAAPTGSTTGSSATGPRTGATTPSGSGRRTSRGSSSASSASRR